MGFTRFESASGQNHGDQKKKRDRSRGMSSARISDRAKEYLSATPAQRKKWTVRDVVTGELRDPATGEFKGKVK